MPLPPLVIASQFAYPTAAGLVTEYPAAPICMSNPATPRHEVATIALRRALTTAPVGSGKCWPRQWRAMAREWVARECNPIESEKLPIHVPVANRSRNAFGDTTVGNWSGADG
jgi:hypothetical protein